MLEIEYLVQNNKKEEYINYASLIFYLYIQLPIIDIMLTSIYKYNI